MPKSNSKKSTPKRKTKSHKDKYEIKYHVNRIPIREQNVISLYISEMEMLRIARAMGDSNISAASVIAHSCQPCKMCKDTPVIIEHNGVTITIPRGILSIKKFKKGRSMKDIQSDKK